MWYGCRFGVGEFGDERETLEALNLAALQYREGDEEEKENARKTVREAASHIAMTQAIAHLPYVQEGLRRAFAAVELEYSGSAEGAA